MLSANHSESWTSHLPNTNGAAESSNGSSQVVLSGLMEKIRNKASQYKVWPDIIKLHRMALMDKRGIAVNDAGERNQLEKCLDTIQKNIKITSLQSMIERLETITRQLGLKFTAGPTGKDVFISSDMFYVEVVLNPSSGYVNDVMIVHQADPVSCNELTHVLRDGDFLEFTRHLEGLSAIYQLNADKKQKKKAYDALHSLEIDLTSLAQFQSSVNDPNNFVHKTPVGVLEPRKGGHPMKLTYFVSPYDLLDIKTKTAVSLTIDVVVEKKLGYSATVCIESAEKNCKLQNQSLITVSHVKEGKSLPSFSALSNLNSSSLPAYFVLKLMHPLPMSMEVIKRIFSVTSIELATPEMLSKAEPLVNLIAKKMLPEKERRSLNVSTGPYFVKLPDQEHCYHMNEGLSHVDGIMIQSIPFTHPTFVPQILVFLRQQVLFNVVIGSCIRKLSKFGSSDTQLSFEVTSMSMLNVSVSFEHPVEESLATLDIDLKDITNVKCKLYNSNSFATLCSDDYASKVMQRSLSIPVTMRSIISKCQEKAAAHREQQLKQIQAQQTNQQTDLYFPALNGNNSDQQTSDISNYLSQQLLANQFRQTGNIQDSNVTLQQQQQFNAMMASAGQKGAAQLQNLRQQMEVRQQLALQLQQRHQDLQKQAQAAPNQAAHQQVLAQQTQNQMLMSMLSDTPAANSQQQMAAFNLLQQRQQQFQQQHMSASDYQDQLQQLQQQIQQGQKPKKTRKRKATAENGSRSPASSTGRSPKRKMSDDDFSRDLPTPSSDLFEALGAEQSRPHSTASSSTPSYEQSNAPRSLEQMLAVKQEPSSFGNMEASADVLANYQFLARSMSAPGSSGHDLDLMDISGFDMPDFGPVSVPGTPSAKPSGKKRVNRKSSDSNEAASSAVGGSDDGSSEQQMILKSLEDLHSHPELASSSSRAHFNAPKLTKGKAAGAGGDGRRCSSAGVGETNAGKRAGLGPSNLDDPPSLKKERKRKRAESVDSIKNVNAGAMALMPPPLITSTGEITSGATAGYAFMDASPNGAPALRPITLNVKPVLPSSTSASPLGAKSPSGSGKKSASLVSSSGGPSAKQKLEGKLKAKGAADVTGTNGLPGAPRPLKGASKLNKISSSRGLTSPGSKGALKNKGAGQVTSSSTMQQLKGVTSPPVSSSSLSSSASPSASPGVSSSKQQAGSGPSSAGKPLLPKKKGLGLSAIVEKLRGTTTPTPSSEGATTSTSPGAESRPEGSGLLNRPDSSSGKGGNGAVAKLGEGKAKYSRAGDQFTVKQGGALKLTVTKTKPSSSTEFKAGLKAKSPGSVKSAAASSSGTKSLKGTGGLKRPPPTYKAGMGFKGAIAGGVSSSSSSTLTSPKASGGMSVSPKLGPSGRAMGKVSSSGGNNSKSGKISSSSGAGAILHAALPPLRIDQLPKIPRTAQATSAAASSQQVSQSSQPQALSSPSVNTSILPQPQYRRVPQPRERPESRQEAPVSSQMEARSDNPSSSDRFQSNAITSSHANQVASEAPAISSSASVPFDEQPVQQPIAAAADSIPVASTSDDNGIEGVLSREKGGVSSSSDTQATSTPSSPAEASSNVDVLQTTPLIIPTESFEEPDRTSDIVSPSPQQADLPSIDSTDNHASSAFGPFVVRDSISSTSNEPRDAVSESKPSSRSETPLPSSATKEDDEEDEDGLVIDFAAPAKSELDSSGLTPTNDPVSSSNATVPQVSGEASPRATPKSPTPPSSTSVSGPASPSPEPARPPTPPSLSNAPSSSSPEPTPSGSAAVVQAPAQPSPSSQSNVSAAPRRSPFSIDDDLMDEALVLSAE